MKKIKRLKKLFLFLMSLIIWFSAQPVERNKIMAASPEETAAIPQAGLIADYSFAEEPEDGKTIVNTVSGTNAVGNAVLQNISTAVWEDQALVFSGAGTSNNPTGTWVSLPENILGGKTSATISIEVKPSSEIVKKYHFLWSIGNSQTNTYWFMNTKDPRTSIKYGGSEKTARGSHGLEGERWYHLTAVIDAETKTLSYYIDGVKVSEIQDSAMTLSQVSDQSRNTIGRAPYNDPLFQGSVSTFRVYDRALSSEEIEAMAAADSQLHGDYYNQIEHLLDALSEEIEDITIKDKKVTLPDYGGYVKWKSNSPSVKIEQDGITGEFILPVAGSEKSEETLTAVISLRGQKLNKEVKAVLYPEVADNDPYGYLMVHFIENSSGYAEKIYLDITRGDNAEQWDPLNGGEPILASNLGTTGVRDPFLTYNPETKTYYIIATDLRVFGGDGAGWSTWTKSYSTKMNIWESKDLITWTDVRQFDVAYNADGEKLAELGMMWAPEATWVPDYYEDGKGAFVVYWSSKVYSDTDPNHDVTSFPKIMWGATTDFTQETYEYGGIFWDDGKGKGVIDTTIIQNEGKTYHITKSNADGICMQSTEKKEWWKADSSDWTTMQKGIGSKYFGAVEGPAVFKDHSNEDRWYLFVDDMPTPGYMPMITNNLDIGWDKLDSPDYYLRKYTKHGGVISLTKSQYNSIRNADIKSVTSEQLGDVEIVEELSQESLENKLEQVKAEVELAYNMGVCLLPVRWDISDVDLSKAGSYEITGTVQTIGANNNQWIGENGSTNYLASDKQLYSSTAQRVKVKVVVQEKADKISIEKVMKKAESIDIQKYTEASVKVFKEALAEVSEILKDENLTKNDQEKVDNALLKLENAINNLILRQPDRDNGEKEDGHKNEYKVKLNKTLVKKKTVNYNSITISWDNVKDASGYEIFRSESKTGVFKKISTVQGNASLTFKDKKLKYNKTYYYKVRAYNVVGGTLNVAEFSNITTIKTKLAEPKMRLLKKKKDGIKVSWKKIDGANGYQIKYSLKKKSGYKNISIKKGKTVSYTIKNLNNKKRYYIKMRAYRKVKNKKVYGPWNKVKIIKLK